MKLIVAGSRDIVDQIFIESVLDGIRIHRNIESVVCGMARGPDTIGKEWAIKHSIHVDYFPADWENHKQAAGPIRNSKMAEYADALIAFWDGKSSGTRDMIKKMEKLNKEVRVIVMPFQFPETNTLDF